MAMLINGFGFGGDLFHGFAAAACATSGFAMAGLVAVVSEALGLLAVGLAVVRLKQCWLNCTDAAETASVSKTAKCNAAKPNVGKATGLSMLFLADATINQT